MMNQPMHSTARYMRKMMFLLGGVLGLAGAWILPDLNLTAGGKVVGSLILATVVGQCMLTGFLSRLMREKEPFISIFTLWCALGTTVFCWIVYNLDSMVGMKPAELHLLTMMGVSFQMTCILLGLVWPRPKPKAEIADPVDEATEDPEDDDSNLKEAE
jgi:hypothetical protein